MSVYDTPITKTITNDMQNPPQNVSERYVNNLLRNGRNNLFELTSVEQKVAYVDSLAVGKYYLVSLVHVPSIITSDVAAHQSAGATPSQAVRRALEKFGVTFK